jgi:hypothetical protein
MSQINTNGIDTNYPVPGQNNSSQGFRDNFAQIRNNLNTAANEITDLQTKVVLKQALTDAVLNNDMANTLISNASMRSFRHTTYNLGNALSGTVLVDASRADVQYGALSGNTTLQFGGWAPTNTEQTITLRLTIPNASVATSVISLPNACISTNNNYGTTLIENYAQVGNIATITAPANVGIIELDLTTTDCGNTISIMPTNRPFQSTQIITRDVPPTGLQGDTPGAVAVGPSVGQVEVSNTIATGNYIIVDSTSNFYLDMPIVFTGNTDSSNSNIVAGTTYYVNEISNATAFTVSTTAGGSDFDVGSSNVTFYGNPASYMYVCVDTYDSTTYTREVTDTYDDGNITLDTTTSVVANAPIIFTGNVDNANSNLIANTVYYVKTTDGNTPGNITVSRTRVNGIAGTAATLGNATPTANAIVYVGSDIWRRINLSSW